VTDPQGKGESSGLELEKQVDASREDYRSSNFLIRAFPDRFCNNLGCTIACLSFFNIPLLIFRIGVLYMFFLFIPLFETPKFENAPAIDYNCSEGQK
jgi:hypothetical protein